MAISSNKSPSPLSARPVPPPHSRTSENTRRSFTGNPFSRPSVLSTHRGFNPVTPANSPAGDFPLLLLKFLDLKCFKIS